MKSSISYEIDNRNPEEKKRFIQKLFDSIVPTYDLANHVLSMGTDILWRRNIFRHINSVRNERAIDLCCGTGDLSLLLHNKGAEVVSLDFSMNMLRRAVHKKAIKGHAVSADACLIPFHENTFSIATIAFGIRNIPDIDNFIKEVFRVLAPGGQLAILELVRPKNGLIRILYSFYLNKLIPFIGGVISGKKLAYSYLSKTIATFIDQPDLKMILNEHGFNKVMFHPQTLGVATIIVCEKNYSTTKTPRHEDPTTVELSNS
jgi:demethylmenaquinone methyltransferase/2-methoxy-6-polyprenyl-1,4-benzoquinol methylase